jgi:hypothetical protein
MSLRNRLVLPIILSTLAVLAGCSGNGNGITNPVAPPSGSFSNSNLNGTYVFSVSGIDVNGAPYAVVGSFTANGSGGITGGTLDMNDAEFAPNSTAPIANAPISGSSSYHVGVDGRGQATLGISTPFGSSIILDFVLEDGSHGLVTEVDGNVTATGSGTLDSQTSGTTPVGSYAFSFSGGNTSSSLAAVGNFTLGSGGTITSGLEDFNEGGIANNTDQTLSGHVVLGPSSTPSTQLNTTNISGTYDVFAINATHLKFIEMDANGTLSGDAFSQTSPAVPTGTMAFTLQGGISTPVAAGGFMVTDGAGNITTASSEDVNDGGTVPATASFSAQYSGAGTGRFILNNFSNFVGGTKYAAYPSTGGLLLLEIDGTGLMVGAAYPQTSGATFAASQGYGLNLSGTNLSGAGSITGTSSPVEVDDIAEFAANSSGATVIGVIDENYDPGGFPNYGLALSGTYLAPDSNGRGQIAANAGNSTNSTLNGGFGLTFYTVDGTTFPFIETDGNGQVASGVFVAQNPSAAAAAIAKPHMFIAPPLVRPHAVHWQKK